MTETDPYGATFQHIELIARKIDKLMQAQLDAERQVLHRIKCDYAAGKLNFEEFLDIYTRYRSLMVTPGLDGKEAHRHQRPTITALWNEAMPVRYNSMYQQSAGRFSKRYEQNEDGFWSGLADLEPHDPRPRDGQAVVYVLFDRLNEPCYVGSTSRFKTRLDAHYHGKGQAGQARKDFARWVAYPCTDREAAYQLEDRLLKQYKPYLNKKASR
ncbi:GIY-YIG nuclease family protein [Sphaerimonospora mesophila]|uniref:GIY-YIG nuclease family protein n=1 Tax=Sphaerimonospora mesophila TaxID=37483 RepID=UPI0006E40E52